MRSQVLWIIAALAASPLRAQARFSELTKRYLPNVARETPAAELRDLDGDGHLDLVLATAQGQDRIYINDGTGLFTDETSSRLPPNSDATSSLLCEDVDGDGDLDLVTGGSTNRLYVNDGTGNFTDVTSTQLRWSGFLRTSALAFGDVDGDGDGDLVVGTDLQQNLLYLNDGGGTFVDATVGRLPVSLDVTLGVALADVDGDGDLDIVFATRHQNHLYLNDGSGRFADATAQLPSAFDVSNDVVAIDVDGDADVDLVFGNGGQQNRLYLNNGLGQFFDGTSSRLPISLDETVDLAKIDLDRDGDADLIVANRNGTRILVNDGTGAFTSSPFPAHADRTLAVAAGDVDGDADPDLFSGNVEEDRLYLRNAAGAFLLATPTRMSEAGFSADIVPADLDGDGDLDLVLSDHVTRPYRNDGLGNFVAMGSATPPYGPSAFQPDVDCFDADGDGDVDVAVAVYLGQNRLLLNDGSGVLVEATAERLPADQERTRAVVALGVEGDGDQDLVFAGDLVQPRLYVNDGSGFFADATASSMPAGIEQLGRLAASDVDGDGDLDLVLATVGQNRLYLNDAAGRFSDATASRMPVDGDPDHAVEVGDVDADGDPDLVFLADVGTRLYLNDGSGGFVDATASHLPPTTGQALAITLRDLDGDGHLDLALSGAASAPSSRFYRNDGTGRFADVSATWLASPVGIALTVAAFDADGDGDQDLVYSGQPDEIRFNLTRHLDAPLQARIGRTFLIELHARDTNPTHVDLGAIFISTGRAGLELPWGTFGLDPTQLVVLPPISIPKSTGVGSAAFVMPNEPSLVGVRIFSQALLVLGPMRALLTNVTGSTILDV
ncbi:MAG: VCBS repeat-containing protein [Planctomycetota bacterium]